MIIFVTGSDGQLGSEIKRLSQDFPSHVFIFTDIGQLDIGNKTALAAFLDEKKPQALINCAAYTAVDKAETDKDTAFDINVSGVQHLSELAAEKNFFLIHISTDYVFDGKSCSPIDENHTTKPASYYGLSKAAGEIQMRSHCKNGAIIRTGWLYSSFGNNFVKTILKNGKEKPSLNVVIDQIGTPTYAADLAHFILSNIERMKDFQGVETYHFSNSGVASWYDFAHAIVNFSGLSCRVVPILSTEYPTQAPRPAYSVLNKQKIKEFYNYIPRHWQTALQDCLTKIKTS